MSRVLIRVLLILGFILLLFGIAFDAASTIVIGILMLVGGFALANSNVLRKEEVVESWSTLIENGQGKANNIFQETKRFIEESKAPSIKMEKTQVSPGIVRGMLGTRRDFLIVTDEENYRLRPYRILLNARDYVNKFDISRYLTYRPTFWQTFFSLIPFVSLLPKGLLSLDLFDQHDLRAYATNAHHCLLKAVEKLMMSLNQDPF